MLWWGEWPSLASLTRGSPAPGLIAAGEVAARDRLEAWVSGGLRDYPTRRNDLAADATSRLSQDLHWGLLSGVCSSTTAPGSATSCGT